MIWQASVSRSHDMASNPLFFVVQFPSAAAAFDLAARQQRPHQCQLPVATSRSVLNLMSCLRQPCAAALHRPQARSATRPCQCRPHREPAPSCGRSTHHAGGCGPASIHRAMCAGQRQRSSSYGPRVALSAAPRAGGPSHHAGGCVAPRTRCSSACAAAAAERRE